MQKLDITPNFTLLPNGGQIDEIQGASYYYENWNRKPTECIVFQQIIEGTCFFTLEGETVTIREGMAFCFQFGENSTYGFQASATNRLKINWFSVTGPIARDALTAYRRNHGLLIPLPQLPKTQRLFRSAIESFLKPTQSSWQSSAQLYEFLMTLLDERASPDREQDPIAWSFRRISEDFRTPFAVKEIADEAGISQEHLTRVFLSRYGITPARMLRQKRLEHAQQLMQAHRSDAQTAASLSGFRDVRSLLRLLP